LNVFAHICGQTHPTELWTLGFVDTLKRHNVQSWHVMYQYPWLFIVNYCLSI